MTQNKVYTDDVSFLLLFFFLIWRREVINPGSLDPEFSYHEWIAYNPIAPSHRLSEIG